MDLDAQQIISPQLGAGERLLWAGRPSTGIILRKQDAFLIPFSLLWGGGAIFGAVQFLTHPQGNPDGAGYVILPIFVVIGLYMIAGRFFVDQFQRSRTYYGLTDQRAIIVSGIMNQSIKSINIRSVSDAGFSLRGDGRGTITFGEMSQGFRFGQWGFPGMGGGLPPAFERIDDAKAVNDMVQRIAQGR